MGRAQLPTRVVLVETGRMGVEGSSSLRQKLERIRSLGIPTESAREQCDVQGVKIVSYPSLVLERADKPPQVITGGYIGSIVELLTDIAKGVYDEAPEPARSA